MKRIVGYVESLFYGYDFVKVDFLPMLAFFNFIFDLWACKPSRALVSHVTKNHSFVKMSLLRTAFFEIEKQTICLLLFSVDKNFVDCWLLLLR